MNGELFRLIDIIYRDKKIEPEIILKSIEQSISSAVSEHLKKNEPIKITIDRKSGKITAEDKDGIIDQSLWGRIAAQTAKRAISQRLKGAEADIVYSSFVNKLYTIVSGPVLRREGRDAIVMVDQVETILEAREQIPGESYRIGNHIKAIVVSVKKHEGLITALISRTHPEFIKKLFALEVPELADKSIELKGLVREAGFRTKIAVYSDNPKIDAVGACVGVRGVRIKNIVEELGDEKIDVIKWNDKPELFIAAAMKPAEVQAIEIDPENKRAKVFVSPDQIALAIGKRGQNIRLASKLTEWEIDVVSSEQMPPEESQIKDNNSKTEQADSVKK